MEGRGFGGSGKESSEKGKDGREEGDGTGSDIIKVIGTFMNLTPKD